MKEYEASGHSMGAVGTVIAMIVGVGVATLVLIFIGVLSGQTYQLSEAKIDEITNTTIKNYVKDGVVSGFAAMKQTADYLPLVVLAVIISIVLAIVLGFTQFGGKGDSGGAL